MSIESAQDFIEDVKNDEDLANRLSKAQDSESRLEIAKQEGYEFDKEEIRRAKENLYEFDFNQRVVSSSCQFDCDVDYTCQDMWPDPDNCKRPNCEA